MATSLVEAVKLLKEDVNHALGLGWGAFQSADAFLRPSQNLAGLADKSASLRVMGISAAGGVGDGVVNDATDYAAIETQFDTLFLPAGKIYNIGSQIPVKPITGFGSIKKSGVTLDGFQPAVDVYHSSIVWTPSSHIDQIGQVPGGDATVLISVGATRDVNRLNRSVVVGTQNLVDPVEMDRVELFGNLTGQASRRLDRVSAFGSTCTQYFGAYEADVKTKHNYWTDGGGFIPGQVGWNVAGYEDLSPGIGGKLADFTGYITPTTPIENASRVAAFGRNAFNLIVVGQDNAGFGYRAGSAVFAGSGNAFFGVDAGKNNIFVNDQSAFGFEAAMNWVEGARNTVIGRGAGRFATSGVNNVILGVYAGDQKILNNSVVLGPRAGNGMYTNASTQALEDALVIGNLDFANRMPLITGLFSAGLIGMGLHPNDIRGKLHIQTNPFNGTNLENANSAADELILENNGHSGLSIRAGATFSSSIFFARPGSNNRGQIGYAHATDIMTFVANGQQMQLGAGLYKMTSLPSLAPAAGSKQLWYDPADGNRVKFVP